MTKYYCDRCETERVVDRQAVATLRAAGQKPYCKGCGDLLAVLVGRGRRTDSQKRSHQQEKRAAKRLGGRVQPASGAGRAKGDVRVPGVLRMECKFTRANSYSLRLDLLEKIEKECEGGEQPAFEIEFQGVYPPKRYVVVPFWVYDRYRDLEEAVEGT